MDILTDSIVHPPALLAARLRYGSPRDITLGGATWRVYDTGGNGPNIILLPGSLGTAEIFCHQIVEFSATHRCIAIDYPNLAPEALARAFVQLLNELKISQATVLGASLAGYWLQLLPTFEKVEGLVLASTFADSDELAHHPLFNIETLKTSSGPDVKAEWMGRLPTQPRTELRDLQILLLRDGQEGELLRDRLIYAGSASPAPMVGLDDRRIAIIACRDDPLLFEQTRSRLLERYPAAARLYLETGGHYPHVTQFIAYNEFLRIFLAQASD